MREFIESLFARHAELDQKPYWINKVPAYILFLPELKALFPGLRFINCTRDGRDVACSVVTRPWGPDNFLDAAHWWKDQIQKARAFGRDHPESYCEIRYEDLILQPRQALQRAFHFLGVEDQSHSVLEAYQNSGGGVLSQARMGQWRTTFSEKEKRDFWDLAGDLLADCGYDRDEGRGEMEADASNVREPAVARRDAAPSKGAAPMKLVFTLTAGRTGTKYLAELLKANLPDVEAHHEILGYDSFGVDTPEISHSTLFNSRGNVPQVQEFWRQKIERILGCGKSWYVETSHVLMKAGLVENVTRLAKEAEVHFIILKRDYFQTLVSYHNRMDFLNIGNQWLWYLDPNYPRNLLDPSEYRQHGLHGIRLWYLNEIFTRAYLYKAQCEHLPNVRFHEFDIGELNDEEGIVRLLKSLDENPIVDEVKIPEKQNTSQGPGLTTEEEKNAIRQLIEIGRIDPVAIAQQALQRMTEKGAAEAPDPPKTP